MNPEPSAAERRHALRTALRQDWIDVAIAHLASVVWTVFFAIGICATATTGAFLFFFPIAVYWTATAAFATAPQLGWLALVLTVTAPVFVYRAIGAYRFGGTRALLTRGFSLPLGDSHRARRLARALRWAIVPGWLKGTFDGAGRLGLEPIAPRDPGRSRLILVVSFLISLHHFAMLEAAKTTLGLEPPFTYQLASWGGPCRLGSWGLSSDQEATARARAPSFCRRQSGAR
jgi:hypothetical protein